MNDKYIYGGCIYLYECVWSVESHWVAQCLPTPGKELPN